MLMNRKWLNSHIQEATVNAVQSLEGSYGSLICLFIYSYISNLEGAVFQEKVIQLLALS